MSKAVKAANESGHDLPVLFFRHSKCLNDYKGNPEDIKVDMPFLIKPAREALPGRRNVEYGPSAAFSGRADQKGEYYGKEMISLPAILPMSASALSCSGRKDSCLRRKSPGSLESLSKSTLSMRPAAPVYPPTFFWSWPGFLM